MHNQLNQNLPLKICFIPIAMIIDNMRKVKSDAVQIPNMFNKFQPDIYNVGRFIALQFQ